MKYVLKKDDGVRKLVWTGATWSPAVHEAKKFNKIGEAEEVAFEILVNTDIAAEIVEVNYA